MTRNLSRQLSSASSFVVSKITGYGSMKSSSLGENGSSYLPTSTSLTSTASKHRSDSEDADAVDASMASISDLVDDDVKSVREESGTTLFNSEAVRKGTLDDYDGHYDGPPKSRGASLALSPDSDSFLGLGGFGSPTLSPALSDKEVNNINYF